MINNTLKVNNIKKTNTSKVLSLFVVFVLGTINQGVGAVALVILIPFFSSYLYNDFKKNRILRITVYLLFTTLFLSFIYGLSHPKVYISEIIRQISWVTLAIIGIRFTEKEAHLFYRMFVLSIVVCLPMLYFLSGRFEAYFNHANHLAYFCIFPFIHFLLTCYTNYKWIYIFLIASIVLITQSSGGFAVLLLLLLLYFITQKKINVRVLFSLTIALLFIFIAAYSTGALSLFYEKIITVDFDNISDKADRLSFGMEGSLVWRMTYWTAIIREFLTTSSTYELLFGKGLKTMSPEYYIYNFMIRDPHNDYVRLFVERGIIGGVLYFFLLIRICINSRYKVLILAMLLVPMSSGNIIVNFPFVFSFIIFTSMLTNTANYEKR